MTWQHKCLPHHLQHRRRQQQMSSGCCKLRATDLLLFVPLSLLEEMNAAINNLFLQV